MTLYAFDGKIDEVKDLTPEWWPGGQVPLPENEKRPVKGDVRLFVVDKNNPYYTAIDGVLFSKDGKELICCPCSYMKDNYVAPESVTKIRSSAFYKCKYIKKLDFSKTGKTAETELVIEDGVISNCKLLETVIYPKYYKLGENYWDCPDFKQGK